MSSTNPQIDRLLSLWQRLNPYARELKIAVSSFDGLRGLSAVAPITSPTEPIIVVPPDLLLTATRALELSPLLRDVISQCPSVRKASDALSLFLVLVKHLGNKCISSKQQSNDNVDTASLECDDDYVSHLWEAYVACLPQEYHSLDWWNDQELQELQYRTKAKQSRLRRNLDTILKDVKNAMQNLGEQTEFLTLEELHWASTTVSTRSVYVHTDNSQFEKDIYALVPVLDMLNHANVGSRASLESRGFVIYAGRTYESGEQLFFEYGQHRNEDLLYQYGFVLEDNLYSKIDLKFDWPTIMSGDPATAEKKLEYLQTLGLPGDQHYIANGEIGWNTISALRVCFAETEPESWEKILDDQPISDHSEQRLVSFLSQYLQSLLRAYPTSLEEDESLLRSTPPQAIRTRLALEFRIGNKRQINSVLKSLASWKPP